MIKALFTAKVFILLLAACDVVFQEKHRIWNFLAQTIRFYMTASNKSLVYSILPRRKQLGAKRKILPVEIQSILSL